MVFAENKREIIGGIIGAVLGFLFIPVLTILTIIIPIPITLDLLLMLVFAPFGYLAFVCFVGAFIAVIGAVIGTGIAELSRESLS